VPHALSWAAMAGSWRGLPPSATTWKKSQVSKNKAFNNTVRRRTTCIFSAMERHDGHVVVLHEGRVGSGDCGTVPIVTYRLFVVAHVTHDQATAAAFWAGSDSNWLSTAFHVENIGLATGPPSSRLFFVTLLMQNVPCHTGMCHAIPDSSSV
jgi:hypothetical protein